MPRGVIFGVVFASVLACGKSPAKPSDSLTVPVAVPSAAQSPHVAAPCPPTGRWAVCSLEKRMKSSGLVARRIDGDTSHRAGFKPSPVVYKVGRDSRLEVFLYADESALLRDLAKLDTLRGVPLGTPADTASRPVWIRSANLAGLLFTSDAREADRVWLAITAGPPQPAR